jgi:hypothetical protein
MQFDEATKLDRKSEFGLHRLRNRYTACGKNLRRAGKTYLRGLNRLRKSSGLGEKHASGASKARDDYMTFMPGINPRPTLKPEFFCSL